jgi:hypothetical protein
VDLDPALAMLVGRARDEPVGVLEEPPMKNGIPHAEKEV